VTTNERRPYVIATAPLKSYKVLRNYRWSIPLRSLEYNIYVLQDATDNK
jgi:hypothetical protein